MNRRDGNANNGFVKWPAHRPGFHNSHEGGMTVYACWPDAGTGDPFYHCFPGLGIKANVHESPISGIGDSLDRHMLAALCLGTSGGSWTHQDGEFWQAGIEDLQDAGQRLVKELSFVYQREPVLITVLDT